MTDDTPVINDSQNHDNVNINKPAVIDKEPMIHKPMANEPLPVEKKRSGLTNGTKTHASYNMTQGQPFLHYKIFTLSLIKAWFYRL